MFYINLHVILSNLKLIIFEKNNIYSILKHANYSVIYVISSQGVLTPDERFILAIALHTKLIDRWTDSATAGYTTR